VAIVDLVRRIINPLGIDVVRYPRAIPDFSPSELALIKFVKPFTVTSPERIYALANAVRWITDEKLPGACVECGVWRGGSMMVVARTLLDMGVSDRAMYLFDTYEGMPAPTDADRDLRGRSAMTYFERKKTGDDSADWVRATIEEVRVNLSRTNYPTEHLRLVKGKVEETIPENAPDSIALLRLDTDWYESTKHELEHLWPRLVPGGICIIDDYGHWAGSRRAVDEYFSSRGLRILMHRIDYSARLIMKV
jgi:O-methyltransferase